MRLYCYLIRQAYACHLPHPIYSEQIFYHHQGKGSRRVDFKDLRFFNLN